MVAGVDRQLLGEAGRSDAEQRARGCARPVRLRGSTRLVDPATGEVRDVYGSAQELDGVTYVRCGNRRAAVCPSCSQEYKADGWHLIVCGLMGGKGVPADVADRPCTFVTLTAPTFGAVHGARRKGVCRARRERPVCPHGRPMWCNRRHDVSEPILGEPLCDECYDYVGHVVWQFHANELWRRFLIALQRRLASRVGMRVSQFRQHCKVSFSRVVEFQARGAVHVHAPMRLDGPDGSDGPATDLPLGVGDLEEAVRYAAQQVAMLSTPLDDGAVYELRWGSQLDTRTISGTADRDSQHPRRAHPEQVASYLAKYLTKATEDFGLNGSVRSARHAEALGVTPHALRLIETAERIGRSTVGYEMLVRHLGTLGYRGHPISKSRAYSVRFGDLRRARRVSHRREAGLSPDADIRQILDEDVPDGFQVVSSWVFDGLGYLDLDSSAAAMTSAALARTRAIIPAALDTTQEGQP